MQLLTFVHYDCNQVMIYYYITDYFQILNRYDVVAGE